MVRAGTLGQEEVQHHGHPQFGMSGRSPIPGRVYLGGMTHLLWCIRPLPEELNLNN
jgi:hypothetical protein